MIPRNRDAAAQKRQRANSITDASPNHSTVPDPSQLQTAVAIPQDALAPIDLLGNHDACDVDKRPRANVTYPQQSTVSIPLELQMADLMPQDDAHAPSDEPPTMPNLHAAAPEAPSSGNRSRFMAGLQPSKVSCDLTTAPVAPGLRFSFEAIIVVVYPVSASPPERRYIEVMDPHGSTGITVWNQNAHVVGRDSVGCVVKFTRLALTMHNGRKNLTMAKDSTMHIEMPTYDSMLMKWWKNLMTEPMINAIQFHDTPSLSVVNISGILGCIHVEEKMVKGEQKSLLVLMLTDRTGKIEIRSWNHSDAEFKRFLERAVVFKRVRVCLYAGTRTGELLTGPNGSTISTDFDHADLDQYWRE